MSATERNGDRTQPIKNMKKIKSQKREGTEPNKTTEGAYVEPDPINSSNKKQEEKVQGPKSKHRHAKETDPAIQVEDPIKNKPKEKHRNERTGNISALLRETLEQQHLRPPKRYSILISSIAQASER